MSANSVYTRKLERAASRVIYFIMIFNVTDSWPVLFFRSKYLEYIFSERRSVLFSKGNKIWYSSSLPTIVIIILSAQNFNLCSFQAGVFLNECIKCRKEYSLQQRSLWTSSTKVSELVRFLFTFKWKDGR